MSQHRRLATESIRDWCKRQGTTWAEMRRFSQRLTKQREKAATQAATGAHLRLVPRHPERPTHDQQTRAD